MPYRDHKNSLPIGKLFLCSLGGGGCASRDILTPVRFADTPFQGDTAFASLSAGDFVAQFSAKISHTASRRLGVFLFAKDRKFC